MKRQTSFARLNEEGETVRTQSADAGGKNESCGVQVGVDIGTAAEEVGNDSGLKGKD